MDSLFILAGILGVGDLVLARSWWRERHRRRRIERCAATALRENLTLKDALERRAAQGKSQPVVVRASAPPQSIQAAIAELRARKAGVA